MATATRSTPRWPAGVDPEAVLRIDSLELRSRLVVEGFLSGLHRSPYHGFSVEFSEYRQYTPGDDPRYLDWKLYARSDRYYIKRFEDETNLRFYLLVDMSRSMGFGSIEYTKAEYARTVAATLAYFLSTQHDAVGLVTFDEAISEYLPALQIYIFGMCRGKGNGQQFDSCLFRCSSGLVVVAAFASSDHVRPLVPAALAQRFDMIPG